MATTTTKTATKRTSKKASAALPTITEPEKELKFQPIGVNGWRSRVLEIRVHEAYKRRRLDRLTAAAAFVVGAATILIWLA